MYSNLLVLICGPGHLVHSTDKVVEDMTEECSKYGTVAAIEIPYVGGPAAGVGYVFVKYNTREEAQKVCPSPTPSPIDNR